MGAELERRQKEMDKIVEEIAKNTEKSQKKQVERREKENSRKRCFTEFHVGDKVWLYDKVRAKRKGGNMAPKYRGPCEVIATHPTGNVKIKNEHVVPLAGWQKQQFVKKVIDSKCTYSSFTFSE